MPRAFRGWLCAGTAVGAPAAMLWLGGGEAIALGLAGFVLLLCGEASPWLMLPALLPLFQLFPGAPPAELAEAMAAAGVAGPGTIAADPAALRPEMLAFAGCLTTYSLAQAAGRASRDILWWAVAAVTAFGCFEAAAGFAHGPGASGTLENRGQYAALLEVTFGAGCGLAAASWAGRSWRERFEDRALLGGMLGFSGVALSLAGIGVSLSRTGIVAGGLAAVAAAAWFGRRQTWAWAALAAVALGLWFGAPRAMDRFEQLAEAGGDPGRSAVWADSLELARVDWLTGVGLGSFPSAFQRTSFYLPRKSVESAHSDYLELFVELGAPAASLLLGGLLAALWSTGGSPLSAGLLAGLGAVLLHATVDLPLQLPALAALAAAALGFSSGRGRPAGRGGAWALGLLTMALALIPIETPQQLYVAAGEASARGDIEQAERMYRQTLDRNLHAAPAWLRLAELERGRGQLDRALLFARAARDVEPFTLRTEWPLAELELAAGDKAAGTNRLAGLVAAAPDLLDAALHTATRSGVSPAALLDLVPRDDPEAAGRYLAFLVRNHASDYLPKAYDSLGSPDLPAPYRDWLAREVGFRP